MDNRTLVEDRKLHKLISRTDLFGLYAAGCRHPTVRPAAYRETLAPEAAVAFQRSLRRLRRLRRRQLSEAITISSRS